MMRILFLGDIFARSGRDAVARYLPALKQQYKPDFTIANGENAHQGFGIMPDLVKDLLSLGIDVITGGNHSFDKNEIVPLMSQTDKVLRPVNYPKTVPGKGLVLLPHNGKNLLIINVMTRLFMEPFLDCPFQAVEEILKRYPLGGSISAIFVDLHGETTSEKIAFTKYFDGRVTAVIGTHTHVPTADAHIMKGGTAYQSDAGMCGDYDSVIGLTPESALVSFLKKIPRPKHRDPANGEGTLCGVFIEAGTNGHAVAITPIRVGPILLNTGIA